MDVSVIASDVHEFTELLARARWRRCDRRMQAEPGSLYGATC